MLYGLARIPSTRSCLVALIGLCVGAYAGFYLLFLTRDVWDGFLLQHISGFSARTEDFTDSPYRWFLCFSPYSRIFEFVGRLPSCQLFLLLGGVDLLHGRERLRRLSWMAATLIAVIFACLFQLREQGTITTSERFGYQP